MKRTIWKFPFAIDDEVEIEMPHGAEVLHVDVQNGQPCMWAIVNPDEPRETWRTYKFSVFGTGHPLPDLEPDKPLDRVHLHHVGTFQMRGGSLVFHIFSSTSSKASMD